MEELLTVQLSSPPGPDNRDFQSALVKRWVDLGLSNLDASIALQRLEGTRHSRPAGHVLFQENFRYDHVCLLIDGIACRYRMLSDGRRQILGYILPGDICDLQVITVGGLDHDVSLLTCGTVINIPSAKVAEILSTFAPLRRAFELADMIDKSILRQWLINIAQLTAGQRLSHFLCEYAERMKHVEATTGEGGIPFGFNQTALSDTLGMSTVHVNRSLQALRAANLIMLRKRHLHVLDWQRLTALATFDAAYLKISRKSLSSL